MLLNQCFAAQPLRGLRYTSNMTDTNDTPAAGEQAAQNQLTIVPAAVISAIAVILYSIAAAIVFGIVIALVAAIASASAVAGVIVALLLVAPAFVALVVFFFKLMNKLIGHYDYQAPSFWQTAASVMIGYFVGNAIGMALIGLGGMNSLPLAGMFTALQIVISAGVIGWMICNPLPEKLSKSIARTIVALIAIVLFIGSGITAGVVASVSDSVSDSGNSSISNSIDSSSSSSSSDSSSGSMDYGSDSSSSSDYGSGG